MPSSLKVEPILFLFFPFITCSPDVLYLEKDALPHFVCTGLLSAIHPVLENLKKTSAIFSLVGILWLP